MAGRKPRLLIFIVAYHAEKTIEQVLSRIPAEIGYDYDAEILIIDDSSGDATFARAVAMENSGELPFPLTVLFNPVNQGYGGNQKIGFRYAIDKGFDFVALIHGDGQYAPEKLPYLLEPLAKGEADAVFGSRMMSRWESLRGGMPLYKYVGNRILTAIQNLLLHASLSEFHSGYRIYAIPALASIPFELNANAFHFDTEIIVQLLRARLRIVELPIPTYYGEEICRVNGLRYAKDVIKASMVSCAQNWGVLYERKFDVRKNDLQDVYVSKLGFDSSHTRAAARVTPGSHVLDAGCGNGILTQSLLGKGCRVVGMDRQAPLATSGMEKFVRHNLNDPKFPVDIGDFDYVLLLDVLEHLHSPENFAELLRESSRSGKYPTVIISVPNVAFFVTRFQLLIGQFNYGTRGILDSTHSRLFTFATIYRLIEQAGYQIDAVEGIPAPYPLAFGNNVFSRTLLALNRTLIRISRGLFSYQILVVARPNPSVLWLLKQAFETRESRLGSAV